MNKMNNIRFVMEVASKQPSPVSVDMDYPLPYTWITVETQITYIIGPTQMGLRCQHFDNKKAQTDDIKA